MQMMDISSINASEMVPSHNLKRVGENVRMLRQQRGLRVIQLAQKLGLSHASLSRIELGKQNMSVDVIATLCRVLCVEASEIFGAVKPMAGMHRSQFAIGLAGRMKEPDFQELRTASANPASIEMLTIDEKIEAYTMTPAELVFVMFEYAKMLERQLNRVIKERSEQI